MAAVACAAIVSWSCQSDGTSLPTPSGARAVRSVCPTPDAPDFYFAGGSFDPRQPDVDRESRAELSVFLSRVTQPTLSCGANVDEAFRFIRLGHADIPTVIVVSRSDQGASVSWVQMPDPAWQRTQVETSRGSTTISTDDWHALSTAVADIGFWSMEPAERADVWAGPASAWVLEGRLNNSHHVVRRGYPRAGNLEGLGERFLRLTTLERVTLTANK